MSQVKLESQSGGVVIPVRAKAAARTNAIGGILDGTLRVCVTAAPERGKANKAIGALLAKTPGVSKSRVTLIAGETSTNKRFLITGVTTDEIQASLQQATDL